jgi:hypothetical protein
MIDILVVLISEVVLQLPVAPGGISCPSANCKNMFKIIKQRKFINI